MAELLEMVGLEPGWAARLPSQLSGGQRQRVGIARALALTPKVLVLDEPVSSLDVAVQAQVIALLGTLQRELGLAYLLIAHDLALVRDLSDRVAVMHLGRIVEVGTRAQVYERPQHPYTQSLLAAVPLPDPRARRGRSSLLLVGELADCGDLPSGCRFRSRCWRAEPSCVDVDPALVPRAPGDQPCACLFPGTNPQVGRGS